MAESDTSDVTHRLLPKHGGYRKLRSFQTSLLVYDGTVIFCNRFVPQSSRTHDQMVQAARSGVQNIAEGSMASATSKKTELKLTNVARASQAELMCDYIDFLRQRGLRQWAPNDPEALEVRRRYRSDSSDSSDPYGIRNLPPEGAANTLICLINQSSCMLHGQIRRLERDFVEHGGFSERMYAVRTLARDAPRGPPATEVAGAQAENTGAAAVALSEGNGGAALSAPRPTCPQCARPMVQRTARKGPRAGQPFWGCPAWPDCNGTRPV